MKKLFCISILFLLVVGFSSLVSAEDCTDSDDGRNFYVKGTFSGIWGDEFITKPDYCVDSLNSHDEVYSSNMYLREGYCENGELRIYLHNCPNGCEDGACLPCTDSDNGKNFYVKGEFSGRWDNEFITKSDYCIDSLNGNEVSSSDLYLKEGFCENENLRIYTHNCPNGCEDGVCLPEPAKEEITCSETDGGRDYDTRGVTTGTRFGSPQTVWTDNCPTSVILSEYYCSENMVEAVSYTCSNGCKDGACLPESAGEEAEEEIMCTDSDGGKNYYVKGTVNIGPNTDKCVDSSTLSEKFCTPEGFVAATVYTCPNGCKDGACLPCTDSDNGKNFYVKGEFSGRWDNEFITKSDYCIDSLNGNEVSSSDLYLKEGFCENENLRIYTHNCPYGCNNGKCLEFIESEEEIEVTEEEIESSIACPEKSCRIIEENCFGKDKIIIEECKISIQKDDQCDEITTTNSKINKNACAEEETEEELIECQGCQLNQDTCVPFGTRVEKEGISYYCSIEHKMLQQNEDGINCQNTYECVSNNCKGSVCTPICSGCFDKKNICIPFGTRTETQYCDVDFSFKDQKLEDINCNNNYECTTNVCVNNQCISPNLIQKIIMWFKNLFG